MKKRGLVISGLILLALCASACDSFQLPSWGSSQKTSQELSSSSLDNTSGGGNSQSSSPSSFAGSSSSTSSSSQQPIEPHYVSFDVYPFNDTHGNVIDTPSEGISLSKTATALKEMAEGKETVYISQGDMWQGSIESNYTKGNLVTEWMNSMGFVSMTVGNHEFDWGQDPIKNNIALANFPMLGINVIKRDTYRRVDYLEPSTTFMRGDAKIGVIGAIGNCYSSISSSKVQDIFFETGSDLTDLVVAESTRLRNEEHCDFIIYSVHGSGSRDDADSYDINLSSGGYVDLVLEGHTHDSYAELDSAGVYHVQCAGNNNNTYKISVNLDINNHTVEVSRPTFIDLSYSSSPYNDYPEDAETEAILDKYHDDYAFAYEKIGTVGYRKNSTTLKSKIADLYLEAGLKKWGVSYPQILLGGGFMSCRGAGYLPAGDVTYAQLAALFPFDNDIVLCSVSGYNLRNGNFIKGHKDYYNTWTTYGATYQDGTNIDNYQTYYLITDTYSSDYSYNHLTVIDTLSPNTYARDLLADYIAAGNWA